MTIMLQYYICWVTVYPVNDNIHDVMYVSYIFIFNLMSNHIDD